MAEKKSQQGGKRKGSGRKKRVTAIKKTVLIESSSVAILTQAGDGYLGKGIDLAADFLKTKREVSNGKEK